jgi:membrane protease subunit HflC
MVDDVVFYEKRILDLDPAPVKQLLTDQKTIEVDAYARYRITNPLIFFQRVRNYRTLQDRFGKVVRAAVQRVIANVNLDELLSDRRDDITDQIRTEVKRQGQSFGIEIVDVRIGRTDLPPEISQNVYNRMSTKSARTSTTA